MKKNLENDFDRREYENRILESLKRQKGLTQKNNFPEENEEADKVQKNSNRMNRIDEELKKEISSIVSYELENSKITGMVSVTKVKTTPDLRYARVYVSILNSKNKKETLIGLKQASRLYKKSNC